MGAFDGVDVTTGVLLSVTPLMGRGLPVTCRLLGGNPGLLGRSRSQQCRRTWCSSISYSADWRSARPPADLIRRRAARLLASPVLARELDVEQDNLGPERGDGLDGLDAVRGLTDHIETICLEQGAGRRAAGLVVVDDEHGRAHVAHGAGAIRGTHCGRHQCVRTPRKDVWAHMGAGSAPMKRVENCGQPQPQAVATSDVSLCMPTEASPRPSQGMRKEVACGR